jgi:hypothetical protein
MRIVRQGAQHGEYERPVQLKYVVFVHAVTQNHRYLLPAHFYVVVMGKAGFDFPYYSSVRMYPPPVFRIGRQGKTANE